MSKAQHTIATDPRVQSISDERNMGDGVWVYLKPGFLNGSTDTGTIHESSFSKCLRVLRTATYSTKGN